MLINRENVAALMKNIKTTFNKALDEAKPIWSKIATKVPSTGAQNDYSWIKDGWPSLRKWIGDKVVKGLEAAKYVVVNHNYESTIAVKRTDLEDDNTGIYAAQARGEGQAAALWPDEMLADAVNGVFTMTCYDGKMMVAADHPVGDKGLTLSNKGTKALDGSTLAKAKASYGAARTAMMSLKNDAGRPLNIVPNILLVPPALEATARTLMINDRLEDGKPNPYKGTAEVVVWPQLTSDTAWFLIDGSKPLMPFIYQERKAPTAVEQTTLDSDNVFNTGSFLFGVEARGNVGFAFWQLIYGSTGAEA
jgi:phage major head subunit gpT-like protein